MEFASNCPAPGLMTPTEHGGGHFVCVGGHMQRMLFVGLGGFIGACMRYALGGLLLRLKSGATFPFETLAINVVGCLAIGFLSGLAETRGLFAGTTRAFLFIGVIGGFTTFSTFGYETPAAARRREAGGGTLGGAPGRARPRRGVGRPCPVTTRRRCTMMIPDEGH